MKFPDKAKDAYSETTYTSIEAQSNISYINSKNEPISIIKERLNFKSQIRKRKLIEYFKNFSKKKQNIDDHKDKYLKNIDSEEFSTFDINNVDIKYEIDIINNLIVDEKSDINCGSDTFDEILKFVQLFHKEIKDYYNDEISILNESQNLLSRDSKRICIYLSMLKVLFLDYENIDSFLSNNILEILMQLLQYEYNSNKNKCYINTNNKIITTTLSILDVFFLTYKESINCISYAENNKERISNNNDNNHIISKSLLNNDTFSLFSKLISINIHEVNPNNKNANSLEESISLHNFTIKSISNIINSLFVISNFKEKLNIATSNLVLDLIQKKTIIYQNRKTIDSLIIDYCKNNYEHIRNRKEKSNINSNNKNYENDCQTMTESLINDTELKSRLFLNCFDIDSIFLINEEAKTAIFNLIYNVMIFIEMYDMNINSSNNESTSQSLTLRKKENILYNQTENNDLSKNLIEEKINSIIKIICSNFQEIISIIAELLLKEISYSKFINSSSFNSISINNDLGFYYNCDKESKFEFFLNENSNVSLINHPRIHHYFRFLRILINNYNVDINECFRILNKKLIIVKIKINSNYYFTRSFLISEYLSSILKNANDSTKSLGNVNVNHTIVTKYDIFYNLYNSSNNLQITYKTQNDLSFFISTSNIFTDSMLLSQMKSKIMKDFIIILGNVISVPNNYDKILQITNTKLLFNFISHLLHYKDKSLTQEMLWLLTNCFNYDNLNINSNAEFLFMILNSNFFNDISTLSECNNGKLRNEYYTLISNVFNHLMSLLVKCVVESNCYNMNSDIDLSNLEFIKLVIKSIGISCDVSCIAKKENKSCDIKNSINIFFVLKKYLINNTDKSNIDLTDFNCVVCILYSIQIFFDYLNKNKEYKSVINKALSKNSKNRNSNETQEIRECLIDENQFYIILSQYESMLHKVRIKNSDLNNKIEELLNTISNI